MEYKTRMALLVDSSQEAKFVC